ncbi:hypothetical protein B0H16DRAFT_1471824, partial [Mycena metata]
MSTTAEPTTTQLVEATPAALTPAAPAPTAPTAPNQLHPQIPLRRGKPFRFAGDRERFLRSNTADFFEALSKGKLRTFWPRLFSDYWFIFPWTLPIDVDPHCAMDLPDHHKRLTHEEVDKRTAILITTQMFQRAAELHNLNNNLKNRERDGGFPAEVFRSAEWWKDFHRSRAAHLARQRASRYDQPIGDQGQIYTFIPTRAAPLIGTIQNDGSILTKDSDPDAAPIDAPVRPITHASLPHFQSNAARRAEALVRARPSTDEQLLARLGESSHERRRRQLEQQIRSTLRPLRPEQRRRKRKLAAAAEQREKKAQ